MNKSKEKIPKAVRNAVWNQNIGNYKEGDCYVGCGEKISINNFHCGHVVSEKNGGKVEISNLKPICGACNSSMGTMNMDAFIKKYGFSKASIKKQQVQINPDIKILADLIINELRNICDFYGVTYRKKDSKSQLIQYISDLSEFDYDDYLTESLNDFKVDKIKQICKDLELPVANQKKQDLIQQIVDSDYIIYIIDYINDTPIKELNNSSLPLFTYNMSDTGRAYRQSLVEEQLARERRMKNELFLNIEKYSHDLLNKYQKINDNINVNKQLIDLTADGNINNITTQPVIDLTT